MEKYKKEFVDGINDDLNAPIALSIVWKMLADKDLGNAEKLSLLADFDRVLGLDLLVSPVKPETIPDNVIELVRQRETYRKNRQWKDALGKETVLNLIEIPPSSDLGDYAFPCFSLAKIEKKSPILIAEELSARLSLPKEIYKIEAKGGYINFFIDRRFLSEKY